MLPHPRESDRPRRIRRATSLLLAVLTGCVMAVSAGSAAASDERSPQPAVPSAASLPAANWEELSAIAGQLTVGGWAVDLDRPAEAVAVHVYVDGRPTVLSASGNRPDVGAAFAGAGAAHGFSWSGSVSRGAHSVCVYALDLDDAWRNTPLGCRSIQVGMALPTANWEVLTTSGSTLSVKGWAVDTDDPAAAVAVHVYVDGGGTAVSADGSRPDVGRAFPRAGDAHGFSYAVALAPGVHSVCLYAIDREEPWRNSALGCRSIGVRMALPTANWEVLAASGTTLSVGGWAVDTDDPAGPVAVHMYVDGWPTAVTADRSRPDVGVVFAGAGDAHGFVHSMPVAPGVHSVCVYAIDRDSAWRNTPLGCRSITVGMAAPAGNWEALSKSGTTVTVLGWVLDPDQPTVSAPVHVYVDGVFRQSVTADRSRSDVAAAFPGAGPAHGFSWSTPLPPGFHSVCVYAIDLETSWRNTALGCRQILVTMVLPMGEWEDLGTSSYRETVYVTGWAVDPDEPTRPVQVHVYVDGVGAATTANINRPDVAYRYPPGGAAHGFWAERVVGPGPHEVCVYAIDCENPALNTPMGCDWVEVALDPPVGEWESVSTPAGERLSVAGWALDPDQPTTPTRITVSISGSGGGETYLTANQNRPDVGAAFPGAGSAHGFSATLQVSAGARRICLYAVDVDASNHSTTLGCQDVNVPPLSGAEEIERHWTNARGANGPMGASLGDVQGGLPGGGYVREFANGAIYWTSATGPHFVPNGPVRDGWLLRGGPGGPIGYPMGEPSYQRPNPPALDQQFQGGTMASGSPTTAGLLTGPMRTAYLLGPASLVIGFPVADARCGLRDGGCIQEFDDGLMTWSPNTGGAWWVNDAVAQAWQAEGAQDGALGYPTDGTRLNQSTGWQTSIFQHGRIEAHPADADGPFRYRVTPL